MAGGRPSDYQPGFVKRVKRLCLLGLPVTDIAEEFGVCVATLYNWRDTYPEFLEAMDAGRTEADAKVAESLYRRARGFKQKATKIVVEASTGKVTTVDYTERFPPDTSAAKFWLINRKGSQWKPESAFGKPEDQTTPRDGQNINITGGLPPDA